LLLLILLYYLTLRKIQILVLDRHECAALTTKSKNVHQFTLVCRSELQICLDWTIRIHDRTIK